MVTPLNLKSSEIASISFGTLDFAEIREIRACLKGACVNTGTFGAHFIQIVASSKAAANGCSIDAILKAGHWIRESTFNRFYNRNDPDW